MRCGEKRVLHWYINLATEAIPLLEMPWKDLKQRAAKAYQVHPHARPCYHCAVNSRYAPWCASQETTPFDHYVTAVIINLRKPNKMK